MTAAMPLALLGDPTSVEVALHLLRHGVQPVPMPIRSKNPGLLLGPGWDKFRCTEEEIPKLFENRNVGFFTGEVSGDLADVDLDCAEAVTLADAFFPPSLAFGRPGRQRSHRLFRAPGARHMKLVDPVPEADGRPVTLVELRFGRQDSGKQTVIYGLHETTGEPIRFSETDPGDPAEVDGNWLSERVPYFAAAVLLIRRGCGDLCDAAGNGTLTRATLLHRMDAASAGKVAEWLDLPKPVSPPKPTVALTSDVAEAATRYNDTNRQEFPTKPSECPACGSPDGFKVAAGDPTRWCCFSSRHDGIGCGTLSTNGERHHFGDVLDLDSYASHRRRTDHLKATGYLGDRPKQEAKQAPKSEKPPAGDRPADGIDPRSIAYQIDTYLDRIVRGVPRLKTHFPLLDAGLEGGIPLRGLTVLGGPPKASKSTLARHIAVAHCLAGGVAYVRDYEDAPFYRMKVLCSLSELGPLQLPGLLQGFNKDKWEKALGLIVGPLRALHLEQPESLRETNDLKADVEYFLEVAGKRPLLVVLDSLQKVPVRDLGDRRAGLDEFLRHLELVKNSYDVAILVTSEMSRAPGGKGYLNFKESGDIEYTADLAIRLELDEDQDEASIHQEANSEFGPRSTLRVIFNRQGRTGKVAHYRARFPFYGIEETALDSLQARTTKGGKR